MGKHDLFSTISRIDYFHRQGASWQGDGKHYEDNFL